MMLTSTRAARLVAALIVIATVHAHAQTVCSPEILQAVRKTGKGADMAALDLAMARLKNIQDKVGMETWDRVARETINVVDPNLGGATQITIHHWVKTTLQGTDDEIAAVIKAVDALRDASGKPFEGLFVRPVFRQGLEDGASTWLINAKSGNRGFLFEVVAARNLIDSRFVDPNAIAGFGFRVLGEAGDLLVEGDLVEILKSGGFRFVDFKATGGNWKPERLQAAADAILRGDVEEMVYAHELGEVPSAQWMQEFNRLNNVLLSQNRKAMLLHPAGTFP